MNIYKVAIERYNLPQDAVAELYYAGGEDTNLSEYFGSPLVQANIIAGRLALQLGLADDYAIITQEASVIDVELTSSYNKSRYQRP